MVYEEMASSLVQGVLDGLNGTFLCYGQTGTGKTHTMGMLDALHEQAASGVVPRSVRLDLMALIGGGCMTHSIGAGNTLCLRRGEGLYAMVAWL